uniref:Uncharacterized protein n=1 Tax=Rousettus aegyptiacus TaxID=9407 RepID=A0A7J8DXA2_ROUAE|nr:hypothetical protein HJG63_008293 [Rousettus aegyptiacus]
MSLPVNGCRARPYCREQCIRFLGRLEHTASNAPAHSSRPVLGVPSQFRGPGFRRVGRVLPAETPQRNPLLAAPGSGGGGCSPGPAAASLWSSRPAPSVAVPSPSLPRPPSLPCVVEARSSPHRLLGECTSCHSGRAHLPNPGPFARSRLRGSSPPPPRKVTLAASMRSGGHRSAPRPPSKGNAFRESLPSRQLVCRPRHGTGLHANPIVCETQITLVLPALQSSLQHVSPKPATRCSL